MFLMSATSLKLHYEPQFGICIFMDRTGSQVVFSCMCTAHCLTLARVMSWVRCTSTLSFPSPLLLFFVLPYLQLVNRLSQENLMAHLSTFLPALLDAFKNQSSYGARLEFQCHCSVVRPMLVLGQAQQPSSDAAWTAAARSSGQARQRGHIAVGRTRLVARGRRGNMLLVKFELQPIRRIWDTYGVYSHCSNASILMMYLLPYAVILC